MDLFLRDCARLLGLGEPVVRRAVRGGELPAVRVQDEYRVGRVDLLEWAMRRGMRVHPELFVAGDAGLSALGPAFERGGLSDVGDVPWPSAFDAMRLAERDASVVRGRWERSFVVGTNGVALPHARAPLVADIEAPALHVLRRPRTAPGGWLLFAAVSPTIRAHLGVLARLAWLVADDAFVELFRGTASASRIFAALEEAPSP